MDKDKPTAFPVAMKDFFGLRPGTGIKEFTDELKALTPEDRTEMKSGLIANGYQLKE